MSVTDVGSSVDDDVASGTAGLVLVGHGSQLDRRTSRPVHDHATALRHRRRFAEVRVGFVRQDPSVPAAIRAADRTAVIVVPLFMSDGYYTDEVIPTAIRRARRSTEATIHGTDPIGTHPAMTDVILRRARDATDDDPAALLVVGHGSETNDASGAAVEHHVDRIRERGVYDEVAAAFLEGEPSVDGAVERCDADHVVAVPAFVAEGHHCRNDVPERLGIDGDGGRVDGTTVSYASAVGTAVDVADVVMHRVRDAGVSVTPTVPDEAVSALLRCTDHEGGGADLDVAATGDGYEIGVDDRTLSFTSRSELRRIASANPEPVTNWYYWNEVVGHICRHGRAFLRWLERADVMPVAERYDALERGISRRWAELSIETALDPDDDRRYEVRHVADEGRPLDDLTRHSDADAARELARSDEDAHYRPLSSARTLRSGWAFPDLGPEQVLTIVDAFYPASVADWYGARYDELPARHVADAADEPGGMPDVDRTTVERAAGACCDDDVCSRRRLWRHAEDDPMDHDPGDGELPCPAPCPHVASVARRADASDDPAALADADTGSSQLDRSLARHARIAEGGDGS